MCCLDCVSRRRKRVDRYREHAADAGEQAQTAGRGHGRPAALDRYDEEPEEHEDHDDGGVAPAPEERQSDDGDEVERPEAAARPTRGEQEERHRHDIERGREQQRAHARRDTHEQKRRGQHEQCGAEPEQRDVARPRRPDRADLAGGGNGGERPCTGQPAPGRSRWQRNDSPERLHNVSRRFCHVARPNSPETDVVAPVRGIGTGATTSSGKDRLGHYRGPAPPVSRRQKRPIPSTPLHKFRTRPRRPAAAPAPGRRAGGGVGYWVMDQVSGMVARQPLIGVGRRPRRAAP